MKLFDREYITMRKRESIGLHRLNDNRHSKFRLTRMLFLVFLVVIIIAFIKIAVKSRLSYPILVDSISL